MSNYKLEVGLYTLIQEFSLLGNYPKEKIMNVQKAIYYSVTYVWLLNYDIFINGIVYNNDRS